MSCDHVARHHSCANQRHATSSQRPASCSPLQLCTLLLCGPAQSPQITGEPGDVITHRALANAREHFPGQKKKKRMPYGVDQVHSWVKMAFSCCVCVCHAAISNGSRTESFIAAACIPVVMQQSVIALPPALIHSFVHPVFPMSAGSYVLADACDVLAHLPLTQERLMFVCI